MDILVNKATVQYEQSDFNVSCHDCAFMNGESLHPNGGEIVNG